MLKFSRIANVERRVFFYACGLAFFLPLSKAVGNIFLVLVLLGTIHRLILKRDDVAGILRAYEKIFLVTGILLAAVFVSALSSEFPLEGVGKFLDRYVFHMSAMLPVVLLRFERRRIILLAEFLLAGVFFSNLATVLQALPRLAEENWRFGGTMTPMTQASLLAMFLPVFVILFMHLSGRRKIFCALAILVGLAAVLFNGTRGAWLAILILTPAVVSLYSKSRLKSLGAVFAVVILVGGIFAATPTLSNRFATLTNIHMQSNSERLLMWESALKMFEDHPLLGIGYGQYTRAYQTQYISPEAKEPQQQHAHNNFIQLLAECGLVGAAAFLLIWAYFSYFSLSGWLKRKNLADLLFFCVLWGLMLHGLTEYNFETSVPSKIFWYALGLCLAYDRN